MVPLLRAEKTVSRALDFASDFPWVAGRQKAYCIAKPQKKTNFVSHVVLKSHSLFYYPIIKYSMYFVKRKIFFYVFLFDNRDILYYH